MLAYYLLKPEPESNIEKAFAEDFNIEYTGTNESFLISLITNHQYEMVIMRLWHGNSFHLIFKDNYKIAKLLCLASYEGLLICNKIIPISVILDDEFFDRIQDRYRYDTSGFNLLLRVGKKYIKAGKNERSNYQGIGFINLLIDCYGVLDKYLKRERFKTTRDCNKVENISDEIAKILVNSSSRIAGILSEKSWKELMADKLVFDIIHLCDRHYLRKYQFNCRFGDKLLARIRDNWKKSEKGRFNKYTLKDTINFFKVDVKMSGKTFR